jgi:transposase
MSPSKGGDDLFRRAMQMKRFIEAQDRTQTTLLPDCLEDYVADDNPVRVVEAFVGGLDIVKLGFEGALPKATGRPAYHPRTLLKIYIYGYLNRIQSSRRLERECERNLELIWLTGRLTPDFKTIADFRKDNGAAIGRVCREFVVLCRGLNLFAEAIVAIDGSKLKAVNNRDKNFTEHKLEARQKQLDESVARYLAELDRADREPALVSESRVCQLNEKIAKVKAQMQRLNEIGEQMRATLDQQISLTDPDARSMATSGRGTGIVGYNVQTAVDTQHHLIVAHDVINQGHDRQQLVPMAKRAVQAMANDKLTALADRGYYNGEQIRQCEQRGIQTLVPKPLTSGNRAAGRFDKQDFIYLPERNEFRCPAGESAQWRFTAVEKGLTLHKYWSSACTHCSIKPQCTTGKYRRITRWEHEDVLDRMQARLAQTPDAAKLRRSTVEHVFGTLKAWMGSTHFLTRTLGRVSAEMSLHVLAYNLKRVMRILGTDELMRVLSAKAA